MSSQILLQYFADFLSVITIGMCLVLKVPQISKLLESKSAKGISFVSLLLEVTRFVVNLFLDYKILNTVENNCTVLF